MLLFWRQIQEGVRNSHWVYGPHGRAFQKSELKCSALQQREHKLQNYRKRSRWRWCRSTWTHVFTDGSAENAVRNGGSGAYIRRPDGATASLSPELQLQSRTSRPESCHRTPDRATSRILSCSLTRCLLFSLSWMAPPTFAPSSYTTACVLCPTTTK